MERCLKALLKALLSIQGSFWSHLRWNVAIRPVDPGRYLSFSITAREVDRVTFYLSDRFSFNL